MSTADTDDEEPTPKDFEAALESCGFGLFNICLILSVIPAIAANTFETTSISYILPTAECDLKLSLLGKGFLNAITYAGMIVAAVPWGFVADINGRIKVLRYGLLAEFIFVLACSLSQNYSQLLIFKFLAGACACGPFAVVMSYISEFHGRKHRPRIMIVIGVLKTVATVVLPIMAYLILPHHYSYKFAGLRFHTWQIFVASTAIPSLLGGGLLFLFPESPKFLMSKGRNEEALEIFQRMYELNTRKPRDTFPIKSLYNETPEKTSEKTAEGDATRRKSFSSRKRGFRKGLKQLRPMFSSPYLKLTLMVYVMQFCLLIGQSTLRLWMPQIFASITEYKDKNLGTPSMCAIIDFNLNKTRLTMLDSEQECDMHITPESYTNNISVACAAFIGYFLAVYLVNKIGNNTILTFCLAINTCCGFGLYWSISETSTLIIAAISSTVSGVAVTTVISVAVNIFPTVMRTMVVILAMTFGRMGSLLGNIMFPIIMTYGCLITFASIGGVLLISCIISFFLPHSTKVNLK